MDDAIADDFSRADGTVGGESTGWRYLSAAGFSVSRDSDFDDTLGLDDIDVAIDLQAKFAAEARAQAQTQRARASGQLGRRRVVHGGRNTNPAWQPPDPTAILNDHPQPSGESDSPGEVSGVGYARRRQPATVVTVRWDAMSVSTTITTEDC